MSVATIGHHWDGGVAGVPPGPTASHQALGPLYMNSALPLLFILPPPFLSLTPLSTLFSSLNLNLFQIWIKHPGAGPLPQNSSLPPPESRTRPSLATELPQSSRVGRAARSPLGLHPALSSISPPDQGFAVWIDSRHFLLVPPPQFLGEVCKLFTLSLNFSDLEYGSHHIS